MTKPSIPTENSKTKGHNTQTPPKTSIPQRLQTDLGRSVGVTSHPTGVVKPVYGYPTFQRTRRLSSKLLKQEYFVERMKSSFRKFYEQYGDLMQQYEVSLSPMLNEILTLVKLQWLPNRSVFQHISWPWYRAWPSPNYEWFPWIICNGCGMPTGNAYPSAHMAPFRPPFWGVACAPIVENSFPELAVSFLDFSSWMPLGTFSILFSTYLSRFTCIFIFIHAHCNGSKIKTFMLINCLFEVHS